MSTTAERLQLYLDAERKILAGQSVSFGDRQLTRADLAEVRRGIASLEGRQLREVQCRGRSSLSAATVSFGGCPEDRDW
jgi:hypothetical protein